SRPAPPAAGGYALAVAAAAVLIWRRRRPVVVAVAAMILIAIYHLVGYPGEAPAFALFPAFYSLTAYGASARTVVGAFVLAGVAYVLPTLPPYPVAWSSPAIYGPTIFMLWAALLGVSVRRRRLDTEERVRQAALAAA